MEVIFNLLLWIVVCGTLGLEGKIPCDETVDTESGSVCYFPFIHENKTHSRCITAGEKKPWCGLVTEVTNTTEANLTKTWDYCLIRTSGSATCTFPFIYNNITYNECIHIGQDIEWCATSESDMSEWGYCMQPCVQSTHFCFDNVKYTENCPPGYVIRVLATEVGKSEGDTCVAKDSDCRILSQRLVQNYLWQEIENKCEFKQNCTNLDLGLGVVLPCPGHLASYVKMTYHCERESDIYLCGADSLCLASYNTSLLLSVGLNLCTSDKYSNKTCINSNKTISLHEDGSCIKENDIFCTPLTLSNVILYLGDVCLEFDENVLLLQCTTDSYETESITINNNYSFCPNGTLPEIHHIESEYCCNSTSCQIYEERDLENQVKELCDWEKACNLQAVNVSKGDIDMCVNGTYQEKIYYDCNRAIYECSGNIFSDTMCDFPSYVNVISVIKGVSAYTNSCKPSADDAVFVVSDDFPQYYEKVLNACNGRTSCADLKAEAANAYYRTNGDSVVTNYVVIEYICEENATEDTSTQADTTTNPSVSPSTQSVSATNLSVSITVELSTALTDATSTTDTSAEATPSISITATEPRAGERTQDNNTQLYIIIGAAAGAAVLLLLLLIILICCCCRSRKSYPTDEQTIDKRTSNNVYIDAKTEEMQLGTVKGSDNQEGSYEYIKDKDLLRKSVLEGAYQDMDTGETDRKQSVVAMNAYQDVDGEMKNEMHSITIPEKDRKQSFGYAEYQDIESVKKRERESKLLAQQNKLTSPMEKTIEEETPEKGPTDIYTIKEQDHAPAEYAEVDPSKKSIKVKPQSDVAVPDSVELTENPYYEGFGGIKPPEKAQDDNAGASDKKEGDIDLGKAVQSKDAKTEEKAQDDDATASGEKGGNTDLGKTENVKDDNVEASAEKQGDTDLGKAVQSKDPIVDGCK